MANKMPQQVIAAEQFTETREVTGSEYEGKLVLIYANSTTQPKTNKQTKNTCFLLGRVDLNKRSDKR